MQDVVALLLGAGLVSTGIVLKYLLDKTKPTPQFTEMAFTGDLICGSIDTIPTEEDDPWGFLLEPCENSALVVMGGNAMCEKHRDEYLLSMSPKR